MKPFDSLNMPGSIFNALGLSFVLGSINPNRIINARQITNTTAILFIKGISGTVYLNKADNGILASVAARAPFELARFQKNPIKNMATMPGDMNPVNSWI